MKSDTPGTVFGPRIFGDPGNRAAVDQSLSRLAKAGTIRRISRGVYDFPKTHPTFGALSPDPDAIAKSIAAQAGYRLGQTALRVRLMFDTEITAKKSVQKCFSEPLYVEALYEATREQCPER